MRENMKSLKPEIDEVEVAEHAENCYERFRLIEEASLDLLERLSQFINPTECLKKYFELSKRPSSRKLLNLIFNLIFFLI